MNILTGIAMTLLLGIGSAFAAPDRAVATADPSCSARTADPCPEWLCRLLCGMPPKSCCPPACQR